MNDRFQADPPHRGVAAAPDFDDGPNLTLRRQPPGTPGWVWLAIGLPLVFVAMCGGMMVLGSLLWLGYSDFDLPAPSDPPALQEIEIIDEP